MAIDSCSHSFEALAASILPAHMARLREALASPLPAASFVGGRTASRQVLARAGKSADFPGCYVFIDQDKPVYVGISRGVIARLVQHLNADSHFSASLVYRMACEDFPHRMKRNEAMEHEEFLRSFSVAQSRLRDMSVAFIEIGNDLELYLFEVMAAMELDTASWNTFRTH
jgi:predicted GIY-YIG superfamily endonuclease